MNTGEPFEKKLELWGDRIPEDIRMAAVEVVDTLELCRSAAEQLFGRTEPEVVFGVYDRITERRLKCEEFFQSNNWSRTGRKNPVWEEEGKQGE
jgi:hypothetical protein